MTLSENFVSKVCNAFEKAYESGSGVTLEGREREFRRVLTRRLFDEVLGWEGHSKIGEIYDITCFDNENFPVILVETKWGVEPTREIKEKLRSRIEELGSVKYGVFASERVFIVYEHADYKLREITVVNVAEAVGVAKGKYGLSEGGKKRILKLELLKRERLERIDDPDYFERTYKEISVAKEEGVRLLIDNLKGIVGELTTVFMRFFDSYRKRKDHYSGKFLENTFFDWLKLSMKDEDYRKGDENDRRKITEVFCRETAYVLLGRMLFVRICEDKEILAPSLSGKRLADFLRFYGRRKENAYLHAFYESREEIKNYYSHLHELGYFDWWWISPEKKGILADYDRREQDRLEGDLNYQIRNCLRRLNRFDFAKVDRDILGDVYQGYLPPDERKRLGEFYTPKEVIEYILDAVGYKPENEIRGKKILDPACGSGSFLVEATQRLVERYRRIGFNLKNPDDAKQIIDGCINSIYGLDIHPFACFIAEMNLLFQLIDLYDAVRQKDRYYKLPRLNIYRTDSLALVGEKIELTEFLDNSRRIMLIEETKGANNVKYNTFDYVVGNPPYIRIHRLSDDQKKEYESAYRSAKGLYDIYCLFIERGFGFLKDGGRLGYICSNRFMTRSYGENLRKMLAEEFDRKNEIYCIIKHIIDFGDSGVFKEVTNYPCILIIEKTTEPQVATKNIVNCVRVYSPMDKLLEDVRVHLNEKRWIAPAYEIFKIPQEKLREKIWILMPFEEIEIVNKMNTVADRRLSNLVEGIQVGVQTGADKILVIDEKIVGDKKFERFMIKKFLKGEDVRRWIPIWKGYYLIYPYTMKNEEVYLYSDEELKSKAPNIWDYLLDFKERLSKRWGVKKAFYELPTVRRPDWFEKEKIITPDISNKNNFAYDDEGFYFSKGTVYGILLNEEYKDKLKYLLGLLNSKLLEFYFKHISPMHAGGYFRYNTQYLEQLPISFHKHSKRRLLKKNLFKKWNKYLNSKSNSAILKRKLNGFLIHTLRVVGVLINLQILSRHDPSRKNPILFLKSRLERIINKEI